MSLRCWVLFLSTRCQTTIKWASYSHTGSRVKIIPKFCHILLSDTSRSVLQYSLLCLSSSFWAGLAPLCPDIRRVSRVVPMSMTDHGPCLGIRNDDERNHTYRIRDWKCCWTFHVEKGLPTPVFLAYSISPSLHPHPGLTEITYPGQSSLLACLPVYFSCFFCASCLHQKTNAVRPSRGTKGMMSFILLKNYQTGRGWRKELIRRFSI